MLRDIADEEDDAGLLTRAKWLRVAAGHHTKMANELIMVARYMKNKTADAQRIAEMRLLTYRTAVAYKELAGRLSKREKLTLIKKNRSMDPGWIKLANKKERELDIPNSGHTPRSKRCKNWEAK